MGIKQGLLLALVLLAACSGSPEPTAAPAPDPATTASPSATVAASPAGFDEFDWLPPDELPDPRTDRLCAEAADPDGASDTTFIECRVEGVAFAASRARPKDDLVVLTYNLERGFEIDAQLAWLAGEGSPEPDVLLLQEADRGCARTGYRNVAAEFAAAMEGYSVFATEFVELPGDRGPTGPYDPPLCEHGNAVVSRYPLGNVRAIRHADNVSWYTPPGHPEPDEPRLGGRVAVAADVAVGETLVRVYSLHLESKVEATAVRDAQAAEIAADAANVAADAADLAADAVLAGGDLNSYGYAGDLESGSRSDGATRAFLEAGFADAHAAVPTGERPTSYDPVPFVLDLLFVSGGTASGAGRCPPETCGTFSDHLPVWATISV